MVIYASIETLLDYESCDQRAFERLVHEWIEPSCARFEISEGFVQQVYGDWRDDPVWMRWEEQVPVFRLPSYPFDPLLFITHEIAHIVEREPDHLRVANYNLPWITFPELFSPRVLDLEIRINAIQLNIEEGVGCSVERMQLLEHGALLAVATNGYGPNLTDQNKQFVQDGFTRYREDWPYGRIQDRWQARIAPRV